MSSLSRFNPTAGVLDFWHEFRKPNPLRVPILIASCLPPLLVFYWLSQQVHYVEPARPEITYITTFDPNRTEAEIIASNERAQEVQELRQEVRKKLSDRKRNTYKALGAAMGMDVEKIAAEADAERAAEEAKAEAEREALRTAAPAQAAEQQTTPDGSSQP